MTNVRTTHHSERRGKERAGLSKTGTNTMANRALSEGIAIRHTFGELREAMLKCHGNIRFYANAIYVFSNDNCLITIIKADPKFEKNLTDYVYYPICRQYVVNRTKNKKDTAKVNEQLSVLHNQMIEKINNEFLNQYGLKVYSIDLTAGEETVRVKTDQFELIASLRNKFKKKYKMNLDINTKNKEKIINEWFKTNYDLKAETTHTSLDKAFVVVNAPADYDFTELRQNFCNTFKISLIYRNCNRFPRVEMSKSQKKLAKEIEQWFSKRFIVVYVTEVKRYSITVVTKGSIPSKYKQGFGQAFDRKLIISQEPW